MITKEKNRTKIICAVVTAISAIVAGGSAFQLYNVQNISQTVNGNVIQILGETGSYVSAGTDLTDSTDELISAYRKVLDENSQYQANQSTLQGQVQSLQNENDDLKNQIQILKGTLLNTYSSDEINSVIEQGGLKRDISKRLDNLECLDSVHCEQVPSVKDLYGMVWTLPIPTARRFLRWRLAQSSKRGIMSATEIIWSSIMAVGIVRSMPIAASFWRRLAIR